MSDEKYEAVIGLEIHAQLQTATKIFCSCSTAFGGEANEHTCPVCTGQPGALPVLNERALEYSIKTGLALNCRINEASTFARKNYFYPDLPKGYQISQYDQPLCEAGHMDFLLDGRVVRVGITRAHMEEDAGKSTHTPEGTLVDLNRSSVPLLEIVSEPDIRTPQEAAAYAKAVRSVLQYTGTCDGNLEEGSMRADCNVSVRPRGQKKLGTKVELKNINSFRFIEKAIQYEIDRQIDLWEAGQKEEIIQETRLYDSDKNRTYSMRNKEEAHDYRYFPDPDLLPANVSPEMIASIRKTLPELPFARVERFQKNFGIPPYDADLLTQTKAMADYYEKVAESSGNPKGASNWVMTEVLRALNEEKIDILAAPVSPEDLAHLIRMIDEEKISGKTGKTVFQEMWSRKVNAETVVKEKGLIQVKDTSSIDQWVDQILKENLDKVEAYRGGKEKLFSFFVGQVMKLSKGQASPAVVNEILKEKLRGS